MLPERGVFALGEGTAPGGGVVLWFSAGGLAAGAEGVPLRGVEQHPGVAQPHGAQAEFGVQRRSGFEEHGVRPQHNAETPTGGQAPRGFDEQPGVGQRHGAEPHSAEVPGGESLRAPDLWKRDDVADAGTEYYSTSPVARETEASGSTGVEQQHGVAPQQVPDLRKQDDVADAATEQYGASAVSRESATGSARLVPRGPQVPPADAVAEQSSGSSPAVSPVQPHERVSPASAPRLAKPVGAGQPESAAHSGAQPGIVRPEPGAAQHLPDHPAVRDVDLEETVVPGEALAPRGRDGGVVAESRGVVVKGFKCARDHLNDPRVSFCAVCGIRMDQLTCILTDGIRPPLGLLLLDDGTSFVLDNDCVLGREPEHAEAVARGARPVRVADHSGGMSRAHAEIRLIDWDVTVVDGGSTNGTHIRQPGHQDWTRAIPGHPVKLTPGAQIQLGGRVATFDSQHGQL
ncbi:hypothetical protein DMB37_00950 [Nocardia sp. CS682]|nr:hypothetical protein DMB37_00950 [Nocardia sp. CS682]